jgi:chaperonin GroES
MTIQPLDDRVLVKVLEEEEQRSGHIIIPDVAKEKPRIGQVLAVGTDEDLQEKIKVNDKILFAKYGGEEIKLNGEDLLVVQRSDILAIIKE